MVYDLEMGEQEFFLFLLGLFSIFVLFEEVLYFFVYNSIEGMLGIQGVRFDIQQTDFVISAQFYQDNFQFSGIVDQFSRRQFFLIHGDRVIWSQWIASG